MVRTQVQIVKTTVSGPGQTNQKTASHLNLPSISGTQGKRLRDYTLSVCSIMCLYLSRHSKLSENLSWAESHPVVDLLLSGNSNISQHS